MRPQLNSVLFMIPRKTNLHGDDEEGSILNHAVNVDYIFDM